MLLWFLPFFSLSTCGFVWPMEQYPVSQMLGVCYNSSGGPLQEIMLKLELCNETMKMKGGLLKFSGYALEKKLRP